MDEATTTLITGGNSGPQSVEDGVEVIVTMACSGPEGPTGTYIDRHGHVGW